MRCRQDRPSPATQPATYDNDVMPAGSRVLHVCWDVSTTHIEGERLTRNRMPEPVSPERNLLPKAEL